MIQKEIKSEKNSKGKDTEVVPQRSRFRGIRRREGNLAIWKQVGRTGIVAHICNPSTQKTRAEDLEKLFWATERILDQPGLQSEIQISWGYTVRP